MNINHRLIIRLLFGSENNRNLFCGSMYAEVPKFTVGFF
jgi:hypothetical protein